jgi:TolA-binding protein
MSADDKAASERRKNRRVLGNVQVRLLSDEATVPGRLRDISRGGAAIVIAAGVTVERSHNLTLGQPNDPGFCTLPVRLLDAGVAEARDGEQVVRLEFEELETDQLLQLGQLVGRLAWADEDLRPILTGSLHTGTQGTSIFGTAEVNQLFADLSLERKRPRLPRALTVGSAAAVLLVVTAVAWVLGRQDDTTEPAVPVSTVEAAPPATPVLPTAEPAKEALAPAVTPDSPVEPTSPEDLAERKRLRRDLMAAHKAGDFVRAADAGAALKRRFVVDWEASFTAANAEHRCGRPAVALASFRDFVIKFPTNAFAHQAKFHAAELLLELGNLSEARPLLQELAQSGGAFAKPATERLRLAEVR